MNSIMKYTISLIVCCLLFTSCGEGDVGGEEGQDGEREAASVPTNALSPRSGSFEFTMTFQCKDWQQEEFSAICSQINGAHYKFTFNYTCQNGYTIPQPLSQKCVYAQKRAQSIVEKFIISFATGTTMQKAINKKQELDRIAVQERQDDDYIITRDLSASCCNSPATPGKCSTGCIDKKGVCQLGTSDYACGHGGRQCDECIYYDMLWQHQVDGKCHKQQPQGYRYCVFPE